MKALFIKLCLLVWCPVLFFSCKKDEVRVVAGDGTAPKLVAADAALVLLQVNAAEKATTFNWSSSDFGFSGIVSYTLQFAKKGTHFAVVKLQPADTLVKAMTVGDINSIANGLELESGVAADLEVRVKATISDTHYPAVYSNAVTLTVTPYSSIIVYPMMYVPGSHQGWDPGSAPPLAAIKASNIYEGYVHFTESTTNFKLTAARSWDVNYGGSSAANAGALIAGGDNLVVNGAGYYFLKANLGSKTWSAVKTAWSVIGDASGSWDVDKDLVYDATTQTWRLKMALAAGALKFRANHSYDISFGDNKPGDPFLNEGGDNIKVEQAGNYEVVLNLSNPGNYTYSIKLQ